MRSIPSLAVLSVLNLTLLGLTVYGADLSKLPVAGPLSGSTPDNKRAAATVPAIAKPERSGKSPVASDIQKLIDEFNAARDKFLEQEKELRRKYVEASKNEREKLRAEIMEKRQEFLDQQKVAREAIRERLAEIKDELKNHRAVIDQAKEEIKDKAKERKGGGD